MGLTQIILLTQILYVLQIVLDPLAGGEGLKDGHEMPSYGIKLILLAKEFLLETSDGFLHLNDGLSTRDLFFMNIIINECNLSFNLTEGPLH